WLGHSALKIEGSRTVFIDPFLSGNPVASLRAEDIDKADVVAVSHDHGDHTGDSLAICRRTGATLVTLHEIAVAAQQKGIKVEGGNIGGTMHVDGVDVSLVPAFHSAGMGGTASGIVVAMDGKTVYHAGDTGLTLEMQLIGEMYRPDIAFLPIDGRYTMTPRLAARAVELLHVPRAVPIHFNTFPHIQSSPEEFKKRVGAACEVVILAPGEAIEL
ncbi:MAG: metal-dependent hydrolase, partial [Candidatus Aminicenantes bacterium]|nr:metal-dependent hydrolase [Candidatus Aminicenantes bacterium]